MKISKSNLHRKQTLLPTTPQTLQKEKYVEWTYLYEEVTALQWKYTSVPALVLVLILQNASWRTKTQGFWKVSDENPQLK